jgi:hypothetical protein
MVNFLGNLNRAHSAKAPLVVIAVLAVIGFMSCDTGGGSGGGGSAYLGPELVLSGQVYMNNRVYTPFTGTATLRNMYYDRYGNFLGYDGDGSITNGNLSYTLGIPRYLDRISNYGFLLNWAVNADDTSVSYSFLNLETPGFFLSKTEYKYSITPPSFSTTREMVWYMYVDGDVTISATGSTKSGSYENRTYTDISRNFSLDLKQGWNALYCKESESGTFTGSSAAPTSITATTTRTKKIKKPR